MRKSLVIMASAALLIGGLFVPIDNPDRYGPFHANWRVRYEIVDLRGRVFEAEIGSISRDSVFLLDHPASHFRLDSIARISQNGIHYYQNPRVPPAGSGRPATEREKWKGEERWNLFFLLLLRFADPG